MFSNVHNGFRCWEVNIFVLATLCFFSHLACTGVWELCILFWLFFYSAYVEVELSFATNTLQIYTHKILELAKTSYFLHQHSSGFFFFFLVCSRCLESVAVEKTLFLQDVQTEGFLVSSSLLWERQLVKNGQNLIIWRTSLIRPVLR